MSLYYKEYGKEEIKIPDGAIIGNDDDMNLIHAFDSYPYFYCWEIDTIHRIGENSEGYFDFNKNIIDIGACLGEYCWLLPFKHAYAFEPNKDSLYRLYANAVLHGKANDIDGFQCLLSDKNENVQYDGFLTSAGGHTCFGTTRDVDNVETKVLDEFNINNVGFIKVDVEGMEEKVLRGGVGTIIRNNYPPILFECWDVGVAGMTQEKHDSLFTFLKGLGYEILEYWGDNETHLAIHK